MDYETIQTKRCEETIVEINKLLSEGKFFNIMAARKRIRQINKSIKIICKYVEINSWSLEVQDVINNQNRIARLRGEKDALAKIIADHKKRYKEVKV